jgi:hypothetical protein
MVYDGNPPCDTECNKPEFAQGNALAWKVFNIANGRDRIITPAGTLGPLPTPAVLDLCELYGATVEDFEKVLLLDNLMQKNEAESGAEKKPHKAKDKR